MYSSASLTIFIHGVSLLTAEELLLPADDLDNLYELSFDSPANLHETNILPDPGSATDENEPPRPGSSNPKEGRVSAGPC